MSFKEKLDAFLKRVGLGPLIVILVALSSSVALGVHQSPQMLGFANPVAQPYYINSQSSSQAATTTNWFGDQLPQVDGTYNLGSALKRWKNGFFSGALTVGSCTGCASSDVPWFTSGTTVKLTTSTDNVLVPSTLTVGTSTVYGTTPLYAYSSNPDTGTGQLSLGNGATSGTAGIDLFDETGNFAGLIGWTGSTATDLPSSTLNIVAAGSGNNGIAFVSDSGASVGARLTNTNDFKLDSGSLQIGAEGAAGTPSLYWKGATNDGFHHSSFAHGIYVDTNGSTSMLITPNQNYTYVDFLPPSNNSISLGGFTQAWKNEYVSSTSYLTNITASQTTSTYIAATTGTLTYLSSSNATLSGGTINGMSVGATVSSTGAFSTLTSPSVTLSGGTINGTSIGATTSSTGAFTTLASPSATLSGGTINNMVIGGTTPVAATFTTESATTNTATGGFVYPVGSVTNASIQLAGSSNTGFYSSAAGNVGLVGGGTAITWNGSALAPGSNNTRDLGTTALAFRSIYSSTTAQLNNILSFGTTIMSGIGAPVGVDDVVCYNTSGGTVGQITHQATNCTVSSERFKEHIQSLSQKQLLDEVRKLRAVQFDYKPEYGEKHDEGFIAEEVALIDPYMAVWEETTSSEVLAHVKAKYPGAIMQVKGKTFVPHSVAYDHISVLLTGALQAEDARVNTLEARMNNLESRQSMLEKIVKWIESLFKK